MPEMYCLESVVRGHHISNKYVVGENVGVSGGGAPTLLRTS